MRVPFWIQANLLPRLLQGTRGAKLFASEKVFPRRTTPCCHILNYDTLPDIINIMNVYYKEYKYIVMTITQLIVLQKVVDTGSFTKAGEALNMTQPAVSHAISSLESDLGVTLLIRDRRKGLLLSDVGKRIVAHVRGMLHLVEKIEQEATAERGLEVGTIRIGSFPSASAHFLPKIIGAFRRKYPNVEIILLEGTYLEVEEWLLTRVVDIGIVNLPNDSLEIIPLAKDKMVVVMPNEHPLQTMSSIPIKKLNNEPFIISKGYETPIINLFSQAKTGLRIEFQILNTSTILKMIEEGLGLSILGELALPKALPNVQIRELNPTLWRYLGLACPSFKESSPAVQLFVQIALDLFHDE
jgi:DNA-binding transcriptional LysR family regulator